MSRYYLHLRDFQGDVIEDQEGSDLPTLAMARDHAMIAMQELLGEAIKHGEDAHVEAIIVADEHGRHVASVPVVAALPMAIVNSLKHPATVVPLNKLEEYRRNADGCRRMAEKAKSRDDKASWLKLADAWLQMLPQHEPATSPDLPGWPEASDEDSKASHQPCSGRACSYRCVVPLGPPEPFAPPCILHRARPATEGDWQGRPERVLAPQRGADRSCGGSPSR